MHLLVCLTLAVYCVVAGSLDGLPKNKNIKDLMYNEDIDILFERFKNNFGKSYDSAVKEKLRREIFTANVNYIRKHNRKFLFGETTFYLGINAFTDLSSKEFFELYSGSKQFIQTEAGSTYVPKSNDIPDAVDWRKKGCVTPIRDQGMCASDWAFSTTGTLECQYFRKYGSLIPFSAQQLLDCSGNFSNYGCNGGLPINAYRYISSNWGLEGDKDYPYEGKAGTCRFNKSLVKVDIFGWVETKSGDETSLQQATAEDGPMSVRIDSSHVSFQLYSGGIYNEPNCSSTELCHAVLVVGYNTNPDYWIVKNSWGKQWGEDGYIRMSRNKNNQCGIATNASYPLVL